MPSYSNYFYYYLTDILGFSQFQYTVLQVVSNVALLIVLQFYNMFFKETEAWIMLLSVCLINCFGGVNSMLLVRGFTFGMSPDAFVFLSNTVTDTLNNAINLMSVNVLIAKLIPPNIEASMFAITTGLINFCNFFLSKHLANWINLGVGVTDANLDKLWILEAIMAVMSLLPIFFLWLVPRRKEVFKVLQVNKFIEKWQQDEDENLTASKALVAEEDRKEFLESNRNELVDDIMKLDPDTCKTMHIYEMYASVLGPNFEHPANSELPAATAVL